MKIELKKWLSIKLLYISFSIMPDCKFKIELARLINTGLLKGIDEEL